MAERSEEAPRRASSRRAFLGGAGAAAAAAVASAACRSDAAPAATPVAAEPAVPPPTAVASEPTAELVPVSFRGASQSGVLLPPTSAGLVAAFDVIATPDELAATMEALSIEIERIMAGQPASSDDEFIPPSDSGAIGPELGTTGVAITLAVGASLFDERFGLADRRPRELIPMPLFRNDRLIRDDISHGDLLLLIQAPNQQAAAFALHQAVRVTERRLQLRWVQEGYNELLPHDEGSTPEPGRAETRNLMGFRDGTSNLDTNNSGEMDEFVWVGADDGEPEWATGGTYLAVRVIRMLIEFWATAALVRQEQIFGRHRASGAPLGLANETDEPTFVSNPSDESIPRRSHIRLANPRTPGTGRILRRGYSYLNGVADDGAMDHGLVFLAFQRSLTRGFLEVQSRLDGEPLEDYIKPVGGGLFFVVPGAQNGAWLGQQLFS